MDGLSKPPEGIFVHHPNYQEGKIRKGPLYNISGLFTRLIAYRAK